MVAGVQDRSKMLAVTIGIVSISIIRNKLQVPGKIMEILEEMLVETGTQQNQPRQLPVQLMMVWMIWISTTTIQQSSPKKIRETLRTRVNQLRKITTRIAGITWISTMTSQLLKLSKIQEAIDNKSAYK
jgi:hypothetical protein